MPRSSTTPSSNPAGSQCPDCGFIPVRRSDMARHKKIHSENKEELLHRCPWPGCTVASLQKSNINTHYNTHTRKKTKCCPDCTFRTVDPGSLTRHRKSLHDYVPKPRNRVNVVALPRNDPDCSTATTRRARRRAPYPSSRRTRLSRAPVSSESASSSPLSIPDEPVFIESKYTAMSLAHGFDTQYFWRPRDGGRIGRTPSPRIVLPAVDTGRHLEGEPRSEETHTQVPAVIDQARPESSATTCHWDTIGLHFDPVANDCSVNFGQQTIPQYLLGEGMPELPAADNLDFDFASPLQQMPVGETEAPFDWETLFAGSASVSSPSPVSSLSESPSISSLTYPPSHLRSTATDDLSVFSYPEEGSLAHPVPVAPALDPACFSNWQL